MLSPVTEFVVCVFGNTQHVSYSLCVGLVVGVLNYSGGLESLRIQGNSLFNVGPSVRRPDARTVTRPPCRERTNHLVT